MSYSENGAPVDLEVDFAVALSGNPTTRVAFCVVRKSNAQMQESTAVLLSIQKSTNNLQGRLRIVRLKLTVPYNLWICINNNICSIQYHIYIYIQNEYQQHTTCMYSHMLQPYLPSVSFPHYAEDISVSIKLTQAWRHGCVSFFCMSPIDCFPIQGSCLPMSENLSLHLKTGVHRMARSLTIPIRSVRLRGGPHDVAGGL